MKVCFDRFLELEVNPKCTPCLKWVPRAIEQCPRYNAKKEHLITKMLGHVQRTPAGQRELSKTATETEQALRDLQEDVMLLGERVTQQDGSIMDFKKN